MKTWQVSLRYALILALVALICTALSIGVYFLTKDKIDLAISAQQRNLLAQVIPTSYFDNDLIASCHQPHSEALRQQRIHSICVARKQEKISAYAFETIAPDGYSGNIRLLVALTPEREVLGVRVLEHKETPGLGDKIELRISNWILAFNQQKLLPETLTDWAVKKDGGKFDQFAGATITPRAIVNQVKRSALALFAALEQGEEL